MKRKPLILIADDVEDYRERLLPKRVERLGGRVCKASNVHDALTIAAKHGPDTDDALDLAIIDMHMPDDRDTASETNQEAGTQCLQLIKQFKLLRFPCIVFTAYPSFNDCVASARAGAVAYVPKVRKGSEGGPDALRVVCERLLSEREPLNPTKIPPTSEWLDKNHKILSAEFGNDWVAFIDRKELTDAEIIGRRELDGVVLLNGASYEDIRAQVINTAAILRARPAILKVRGMR